ncbi:hypothetical protein SAMN02745181_2770 [Rubritalea squalenifaciens DSM 18772]|uniref:Uncharacterized protein n=1 Tax=Rubritalea squalenifaciens DSM 18772 TaxID=1123071 RepID=A0A1M6N8E2_9BACT|nr:hypothetical protein [Rubritalea squalenifaciens]SHJ91914.1 hypothetical protein SAMN02745181_2770 [Rubritalea squalenifaciens DSM 18772]
MTKVRPMKEMGRLSKLWFTLGDRLSPRGLPTVYLRYHEGECIRVSGKLTGWVERQVAEYLGELGVRMAFVKQYQDKSYAFSNNVPDAVRQRIRNVLNSH